MPQSNNLSLFSPKGEFAHPAATGRSRPRKHTNPTRQQTLSQSLRIGIPSSMRDCVFLTNDPGMSMKTTDRPTETTSPNPFLVQGGNLPNGPPPRTRRGGGVR